MTEDAGIADADVEQLVRRANRSGPSTRRSGSTALTGFIPAFINALISTKIRPGAVDFSKLAAGTNLLATAGTAPVAATSGHAGRDAALRPP